MTLRDLVYQIVDLINSTVVVLGGIALVLFLISVLRYIAKGDEAHGKNEERKAMGWGLLALFVLFSIWGILSIFKEMIPYTQTQPGGGGGNTEVLL